MLTETVTVASQTDIALDHCYAKTLPPHSPISTNQNILYPSKPSTSSAYVSPSKSTSSENTSPAKSISSVQLDTDSDGDNIDDTYIPGSADSQSETETENDDASEKSPVYQRKIIVFEEQLDKLLSVVLPVISQ